MDVSAESDDGPPRVVPNHPSALLELAQLPIGAGDRGMLTGVTIEDLDRMIGASLLVRVTYLKADDTVGLVAEFAGVVISVDPLVTIERGEDEPFTLPPDPDAFDVGMPGEYPFVALVESCADAPERAT